MEQARKGRRSDPAKDEAIVEAARALFIERGYGVSIDEIAARAGVSKQTIYARYEGKADLLVDVVHRTAEELVGPLGIQSAAPQDALAEFGKRFLEVVFDDGKLAMQRLLISEAASFPELAQRYYQNGPRFVHDRLAAYIAKAAASGKLYAPDPREAASQFLGLVIGSDHLSALLGVSGARSRASNSARVKAAVAAFMKLYGNAGRPDLR